MVVHGSIDSFFNLFNFLGGYVIGGLVMNNLLVSKNSLSPHLSYMYLLNTNKQKWFHKAAMSRIIRVNVREYENLWDEYRIKECYLTSRTRVCFLPPNPPFF